MGGSSYNYERKQGLPASVSYKFISHLQKPNPQPSLLPQVHLQVPYLRDWHCHPPSYASQTPPSSPAHPIHHQVLSVYPPKDSQARPVLRLCTAITLVQVITTSYQGYSNSLPSPVVTPSPTNSHTAAAVAFQTANRIRTRPSSPKCLSVAYKEGTAEQASVSLFTILVVTGEPRTRPTCSIARRLLAPCWACSLHPSFTW